MADSDNVLKLLIQLGVVGQDQAESVQKSLTQAASATEELTTKTKAANDAAMEGARNQKALNLLFDELDKLVPGLGRALGALFDGPLGPLMLLSAAVDEVLGKLRDYNEELDREGEAAYQPHLDALDAMKKAWDDVSSQYADYQVRLANAGKDQDPIKTHLDRVKELTKAQLEADKTMMESQAKLEEQYVRTNGAKMGLSPEQINQQVAAIRDRLADKEGENQRAQNDLGVAALNDELTLRKADLEPAKHAADAATANDNAVRSQFDHDQSEMNHLQSYRAALTPKELDNLRQTDPSDPRVKLEDAQKKLEQLQNDQKSNDDSLGDPESIQKAIDETQTKIKQLNQEVTTNQQRYFSLNNSEADRKKALGLADQAALNAQNRAATDKARITQLDGPDGEIAHTEQLEGLQNFPSQFKDVLNTKVGAFNQKFGDLANMAGYTYDQQVRIVQQLLNRHETMQQVLATFEQRIWMLETRGYIPAGL